MEFNNHLIDEKFVRNKEEELYCIKFSSDSGEYSTVEITSSSNPDKKYTFIEFKNGKLLDKTNKIDIKKLKKLEERLEALEEKQGKGFFSKIRK